MGQAVLLLFFFVATLACTVTNYSAWQFTPSMPKGRTLLRFVPNSAMQYLSRSPYTNEGSSITLILIRILIYKHKVCFGLFLIFLAYGLINGFDKFVACFE